VTTEEFIDEKARERDRFELELSDTFDVKASIVLLILTFLGTIAATILTAESLAKTVKLAQIPVIAAIVVSGIFCVASLWPRNYLLDDMPERYTDWLAAQDTSESAKLQSVTRLNIELANRRINHNHALNRTKSWSLNGAFWSMSVGLFVELGAITYIAFAIHPS
jgi:hypothetical protein